MKIAMPEFLPSALAAAGLIGAAAVFVSETLSFRDAVAGWAASDLNARAELAAANLREPLETGNFRIVHEFGAACAAEGMRFTVFSAPGGVVYDSTGNPSAEPESMFAVCPCGEFKVRLGLPLRRVFAPYRRARVGFLLAALVGGSGVMLIVLFTVRQRSRMRELARERDVQRKLVEEMRKVEAFRRDFIADVSHEVKTPLTGIIGSVDLLASGNLPPDAQRRLLDMVRTESQRLNALAQGILSLARLERGDAADALSIAAADLGELVRETADRLRPYAEENGMSISVGAPESLSVMCDAQLMSSAISNLVMNAIRHSRSKEVALSLSESGGRVRIAVEDHGVGIPPAERERVFERFHRVDAARTSDTGGAGLGLAIVRQVARLHGGDATLEAVEPSGCRFVLEIPSGPA